MAEPKEIAIDLLAMPESDRLERMTKILEMVQCGIMIRSACRDKFFVSMSGREDSGTKFDRLLKELFGLSWEDRPKLPKKRRPEPLPREEPGK